MASPDPDSSWVQVRNLTLTIARIAISAVLLAVVVSRIGFDVLVEHLARIEPVVVGVAILLSVGNVTISAWKWRLLLGIKGRELPFRLLWTYYYIGQFFNAFLPTAIGGDAARIYYLHAEQDGGVDSVSSVVMERLTGLAAIFTVAGTAAIVGSGVVPGNVRRLAIAVSAIGLVGIGLLFSNHTRSVLSGTVFRLDRFDIGHRTKNLFDSIQGYNAGFRQLGAVFALSLLFRGVLVVNNYVVAVGLGMDVPLLYFLVVVPIAELVLFVPISIQGFGVREATYVVLFTAVGASAPLALAVGVVMQLVLGVLNNVLGGIVYLGYRLNDSTPH